MSGRQLKRTISEHILGPTKRPKTEYENVLSFLFLNIRELYTSWMVYVRNHGVRPSITLLNHFLENIWGEIGQCFKAHDVEYFEIYKNFDELLTRMGKPIHEKIVEWKRVPLNSIDAKQCNNVSSLSEQLDSLDLEEVDPYTGKGFRTGLKHFFGN